MKKIVFSPTAGITEVEEFPEDVRILGDFTDFFVGNAVWRDGWFGPEARRENLADLVGLTVGDGLFAYIDEKYPITKL